NQFVRDRHIVEDGFILQQPKVLKYKFFFASRRRHTRFRDMGEVSIVHNNLPFIGDFCAKNQTEKCCFAGAASAGEENELSLVHLKTDVVKCHAAVIGFRYMKNLVCRLLLEKKKHHGHPSRIYRACANTSMLEVIASCSLAARA